MLLIEHCACYERLGLVEDQDIRAWGLLREHFTEEWVEMIVHAVLLKL